MPKCEVETSIEPQVIVEEPKIKLPIRISIYKDLRPPKTFKESETLVNFFHKPIKWRTKKHVTYEQKPESCNICKWYKRKRALQQLRADRKKELKALERQRREEYEKERMRELIRWETLKKKSLEKERGPVITNTYEVPIKYVKPIVKTPEKVIKEKPGPPPKVYVEKRKKIKKEKPPPTEKIYVRKRTKINKEKQKNPKKIIERTPERIFTDENPVHKKVKETPIYVRPAARSKYVSVKKYNDNQTLTHKFVNCCYKVCCQFYCYLTCIIIIVFTVMFLI